MIKTTKMRILVWKNQCIIVTKWGRSVYNWLDIEKKTTKRRKTGLKGSMCNSNKMRKARGYNRWNILIKTTKRRKTGLKQSMYNSNNEEGHRVQQMKHCDKRNNEEKTGPNESMNEIYLSPIDLLWSTQELKLNSEKYTQIFTASMLTAVLTYINVSTFVYHTKDKIWKTCLYVNNLTHYFHLLSDYYCAKCMFFLVLASICF